MEFYKFRLFKWGESYDLNERILIDRQTVKILEGFPISTPYVQILRINGKIVQLRILH